ncbi:secretin N-terminal domain-containing protein, partial [Vibrio salilacus]|uniref:secretin N-terminal domain-containing protein n=1 Tax=Vibrio salilacus TaxID=1323749 RepID=UPI002481AE54
MNHWLKKSAWLLTASLLSSPITVMANEYSASFKGTDIQEFINIVGRNLEKTVIVDPSVRGKVDVRSYDMLSEEQYYSFFLNVLEVYGFAVVEMDNGVLKVIKSKDAKTSAIPVVGDGNINGDEVVTRVVAVRNVSVRELSPLLRQLNDNAGAGNVVHYDPANIILITGRAAVVNRLADIIKRVDQAGDKEIEVVELNNASAAEMVRIVEALNKTNDAKNTPAFLQPQLVADDRTN